MEELPMRDIYTIQIHRTTNAENRSPDCEVCKNGVIHLSSLQVRQFSQSGRLPNVCRVCNKEFLKVCRMQIRHLTQPDSQRHVCDICHKIFIHAGNLKKHRCHHHKVKMERSESQSSNGAVASAEVDEPDNREEEVEAISEEVAANIDDETEPSSVTVKEEPTPTFQKTACFCKLCSKQFKDELCFTKHCQVHSEKQNFFCSFCKKSFESKSLLRAHNRDDHEMRREYLCNICCSVFADMVSLKDHCVSQHNNVANGRLSTTKDILGRPIFTCTYCNRQFIQKVAFERHHQLHEGATPLYTCDVCQKSYIQHARLQMHQRLHNKTKFFSCPICNKQFQLKKAYKKHCESHTGEEDEFSIVEPIDM